MAVRGPRHSLVAVPQAMSPESALASDLFDQFVSAGTFKTALSTYRQICDLLQLSPSPLPSFYPRLKAKLRSWRAASLWAKLDKRASHKCYNRGKACSSVRVLIIGGGPCGLRAAIEAQLLGSKVVVLEKRDRYSRNNVLHLWPFVIHDLRNLGAKKFFGKFCAGSIDHISIRQLQLILLKVALLLGVEVHENVTFKDLLDPPEDQTKEKIGWRAQVLPADHPASQYEFDVLIGADGKRNTLKGFNRKEFRGKLAIAITANFMNRHTLEEARVPEISGVAFIFNQKFFQEMKENTAIDLENIVYYKDDTHYFVMTAKKQSLLEKGVIINDYSDTARLLSQENVDKSALMEYAREAADFATGYAMPSFEFAVNHYGQADVAMFDFTSMYAADNACRLLERRGHWLLQGLVGDSLLEPFWPTGSGCARGFLSSLDAAWMVRSWANNKDSPLHVLAERESIYRLLAQTTPENLSKDLAEYSLNPSSRYPNLNLLAVLPSQVRSLCRAEVEIHLPTPAPRPLTEMQKKRRRRESIIHPDALLSWCQRQVALYTQVKIENMTTSWKDGLALCAILHRYRPDLVDLLELSSENSAANNQRAFDILEKEYGIPPVMTGLEMASCTVPDKLTMVSYLSQVYETFRGEIPQGRPVYKASKLLKEKEMPPPAPLNLIGKITNKVQSRRKSSTERDTSRERDKSDSLKRSRVSLTRSRRSRVAHALSGNGSGDARTPQYERILKALDKDSFTKRMQVLQEQIRLDRKLARSGRQSGHASSTTEDESCSSGPPGRIPCSTVQQLQEQLKFGGTTSPPKKKNIKVGRLGKDEWNVKMLEERLKQREKRQKEAKVHVEKPKVLKEIFDSKLQSMDARLKADGGLTDEERIRYSTIDDKLHKLEKQLREGSLDVGTRGRNRVAAMAGYIANVLDNQSGIREKRPPPPPPVVLAENNANSVKTQTMPLAPTVKAVVSQPEKVPSVEPSGVSEICCFCHKRVYLMERLSAEGLFFHRGCFRCDYCQGSLRLGNYAYDRAAPYKGKFYCGPHFRMERPSQRWQEMMRRKHAFLLAEPQPPSLVPPVSKAEDIQDGGHPTPAEAPRTPSPPLGAGEDMGDPSQIEKQTTPFAEDGTAVTFQVKTYETPTHLSLDDMNAVVDVDNTPERVEFENSLELLSEDDLLTSELEEEELAQKNLGKVGVPTSDDECSDLSSEEDGSESESLVEEIEHSLTADETRHMAETWQRKHASSLDANACNDGQDDYHQGASSSSLEDEECSTEGEDDYEEDEETETETGEDATSQDIDSDDEYSPHEPLSDEEGDVPEPVDWSENVKEEGVTVAVPVLKTDAPVGDEDEESSEEYISDEEGLTVSSSEESSESEAEVPLPKHEIPTIVIDQSPGEQDMELDWGPKEVRAALGKFGGALESDVETDQPAGSSSSVTRLNEQCTNHGAATAETGISPKSSDGQTSSDHLSLQNVNKLNKSAESLTGMSVSSGLSSSSNVDDLSEVKQAGREDLREDIASPSLTDVSEVSSLVDATPGSLSPALTPGTETRGYGIMVDRVGSSESSCAQSPPEDHIGTSTASDSSAVPFGALRIQSASSSAVTSASSGGPSLADQGLGTDASDIEEQELLSPFPEHSSAAHELSSEHLESSAKPESSIEKASGEPSRQPLSEPLKSGTLSPNIPSDEAAGSEISDSSRSTVIERAALQQSSAITSTPPNLSLSTKGYAFRRAEPSRNSEFVIGLTLTCKATKSKDEQKFQSSNLFNTNKRPTEETRNAIGIQELPVSADQSATLTDAQAPQKLHGQVDLLQAERKNRSIFPLLSANKTSTKQADGLGYHLHSGSIGGTGSLCNLHVPAKGALPNRVPTSSCKSTLFGPPESSDTSTADLTGETMIVLHPAPICDKADSDEVSEDRNGQEDSDTGEKDIHPSGRDRSKLTLKLKAPNRPTKGTKESVDVARDVATPEILSPQSDSLGEGDSGGAGSGATTCSASISDQEVFSPGDDIPALEDEICEVANRSPYAPIARMSDEDLTVSEWQSESRSATTADSSKHKKMDKELQIKEEELEHSQSKDIEVEKGIGQSVNGRELLTVVGSDDDLTVSEWAKEGSKSDILSGLEDLNKEFKFDDRHVTRRRKKKHVANCDCFDDDLEKQKSQESENKIVKHEASNESEGIENEVSSDTRTNEMMQALPHDENKKGELKQPVRLTPEPQKFQGYGGSFAEKVSRRPSGSDGNGKRDSIYLKSLNINLQMLDFPSVRSSSPGSLGSCEELDQDRSKDETPVQPFIATLPKPSTQTRSKKNSDQRQQPRQLAIKPPTDDANAATTQLVRPCLDPVTAMLMSRREASRKSVHEDIQNLPFFDSLSLASDVDEFKTPEAGTPTDEHFSTPPTSRLTCSRVASFTDPERERARREARERARLKSDEELGLSPCSYRRRYIKTPAFDELTLTDLLDPDDEDEAFNAIDDRSSLRSFSIAQHRLAQFEDDDEDSITPVVSPMQSNEELDHPEVFQRPMQPIVIPDLYEYIPSQSSRVVASRKSKPKPKRRLFSRNEDEERKSLTKRSILSFLGFNKNGGSDGPTSKERKECYNKEQAARSAEERSPSREKTFSRLRLTRLSKEKAPKKSSSNQPAPTVSQEGPTGAPSVLRKKPIVNESKEPIKKHISLDNLKSQPIVLPAKSRSVEFDSMVPQASEEDSLSDHDDKTGAGSDTGDRRCKGLNQRRLERLTQKVHRQHELKRLRTAQEIQRRLEEIEVSLRALERRGVLIERALRGEDDEDEDLRSEEGELTQVLFGLMRQKNKLSREEQELLIRVKDLELENHHSKLQQEMRERMAVDDNQKSVHDIEKERQILNEMLDIVEKRDRLVAQMDQLRIREEKEDKELLCQMQVQEVSSCQS